MASKTQDQIERERALNERRAQGGSSGGGGQSNVKLNPDTWYKTGETNPNAGYKKRLTKQYSGYEQAYNNQQENIYNQSVEQANKNATNAHRQQYISYMQNRRDLPRMLAENGMNGGAGETSRLNLLTNYQNNRNATDAQRAAQIAEYRNAMNNNIAAYQQQNQMALDSALETAKNAYDAWNSEDLAKQKNIYVDTINGWSDVDAIDKEIARIQASGVDTWRISYLRTRRNALLEALAEEEAASGGYGGGSGRSGGGYTGGGGDDDNPTDEDMYAVYEGLANAGIGSGAFLKGQKTGAKKPTATTTKPGSVKTSGAYQDGRPAYTWAYPMTRPNKVTLPKLPRPTTGAYTRRWR